MYAFPDAYITRGELKEKNGDITGASHDYKQAIKFSPKSALGWNKLGFLKFRQRKFEEASKYYARGLQIDPKNLLIYNNRRSIKGSSREFFGGS